MAKRTIREEWVSIPGCPGYEVSDQGRVRSLDRWVRSQFARTGTMYKRFYRGKMLSPKLNPKGYYIVDLGGRRRSVRVHRLVLRAFRGPPPKGLETRHKNGDQRDNRLNNLVYGTHQENMRDRVRHGTDAQGERNPSCKLAERDVRAIRRSSLRQSALAEKYGVSQTCISDIVVGRAWGWLK